MGAQTGGRVVTPPQRKFKKNAPAWYEERHEQQRKAHSSRRIRLKHGIAHLKNWRALARHFGRRENMSDIVQAVAGLLSHQHRHPRPRPSNVTTGNATHLDVPQPTVHEVVKRRLGMRAAFRGPGHTGDAPPPLPKFCARTEKRQRPQCTSPSGPRLGKPRRGPKSSA
ncbi:hypothetical protein ACIOHS_46020 [Streptomyces sp. NPDC088253]|uniref:hypothetical protein n=1 Tax=Streptomyces sp. NPDC088253 TaxID=3365846 RepID=UPI0038174CEB